MAVMLYKKGKDHVVNGVECDVIRCDVVEIPHYEAQGYVRSVEELKPKGKKKSDENKGGQVDLVTDPEVIKGMEREELKVLAKAMGLKPGNKKTDDILAEVLEAVEKGE